MNGIGSPCAMPRPTLRGRSGAGHGCNATACWPLPRENALPDLTLHRDGQQIVVRWMPDGDASTHPALRFRGAGEVRMNVQDVEQGLAEAVQAVLDRLDGMEEPEVTEQLLDLRCTAAQPELPRPDTCAKIRYCGMVMEIWQCQSRGPACAWVHKVASSFPHPFARRLASSLAIASLPAWTTSDWSWKRAMSWNGGFAPTSESSRGAVSPMS